MAAKRTVMDEVGPLLYSAGSAFVFISYHRLGLQVLARLLAAAAALLGLCSALAELMCPGEQQASALLPSR